MELLTTETICCPYCGERLEVGLDLSELGPEGTDYVEDCQVCCRPIEFHLAPQRDGYRLEAHRDDD